MAISPLHRADLAIEGPAGDLFALGERALAWTAHTCPVGRPGCTWMGRRHGGNGAGRRPSMRRRIFWNSSFGAAGWRQCTTSPSPGFNRSTTAFLIRIHTRWPSRSPASSSSSARSAASMSASWPHGWYRSTYANDWPSMALKVSRLSVGAGDPCRAFLPSSCRTRRRTCCSRR